jgi:hypothetical protein
LTVAPGIMAPLVSTTVPDSEVVLVCAVSHGAASRRRNIHVVQYLMMRFFMNILLGGERGESARQTIRRNG